MTLDLLRTILQAISSFAIAGGLIFTAVQFMKSRNAAHVANFTKLIELQMTLRRMRVDDPTLAYVYRHDVENQESDRAIREYFFNLMQLSIFEIVWFSYTHQQLPRDYFLSWDRRMREIASEPSFRLMWANRGMKIMHDEFQVYMDELVAETPLRTPMAIAPRESV